LRSERPVWSSEAVGRVGKVQVAVGRAHDIVGAVETFAFVVADHGFNTAIGERARDAAVLMLARDQTACAVVGVAVGNPAWTTENLLSARLGPAVHRVTTDVTEDQTAFLMAPNWPLGEDAAPSDLLSCSSRVHQGS